MVDKLIAALALAFLAAFIGIIVWFVPDLDLIIVSVIAVAMGAYDFYKSSFRSGS